MLPQILSFRPAAGGIGYAGRHMTPQMRQDRQSQRVLNLKFKYDRIPYK
jgi:hypothetical protein